jgi:hypothetical protein
MIVESSVGTDKQTVRSQPKVGSALSWSSGFSRLEPGLQLELGALAHFSKPYLVCSTRDSGVDLPDHAPDTIGFAALDHLNVKLA